MASDKIKSRSVREYFVAQIPTITIILSGRIARKHSLNHFLTNVTLMFAIARLNGILSFNFDIYIADVCPSNNIQLS